MRGVVAGAWRSPSRAREENARGGVELVAGVAEGEAAALRISPIVDTRFAAS